MDEGNAGVAYRAADSSPSMKAVRCIRVQTNPLLLFFSTVDERNILPAWLLFEYALQLRLRLRLRLRLHLQLQLQLFGKGARFNSQRVIVIVQPLTSFIFLFSTFTLKTTDNGHSPTRNLDACWARDSGQSGNSAAALPASLVNRRVAWTCAFESL